MPYPRVPLSDDHPSSPSPANKQNIDLLHKSFGCSCESFNPASRQSVPHVHDKVFICMSTTTMPPNGIWSA